MPVTAKLSRRFYETFGDEVTNEVVEWFNQVDLTYRGDLRELNELNELNFARFDAKVEQRFAEFEARWGKRLAELEARHLPIKLWKPPIAIPNLVESMQWHRVRRQDPALAWLRGIILNVAAVI